MVHRFKPKTPPAALMHPKWNSIKSEVLSEKNNHDANTACYRDTTIGSLMDLYDNKCAICERSRGTELQVDHYRPKKNRNNTSNKEYNQSGYYWLTYEWENLIPLCSKCNQKKSNKFPLKGWNDRNRISDHLNINNIQGFNPTDLNWLQQYERPLMINPEIEIQPARHFIFKSDGEMLGRTEEGEETIKICDLNRKDLRRERIEDRQKYIHDIKSAFDDYSNSILNTESASELKGELKGIFKRIKKNCDEKQEFSLFHIYMYKYFEYYIGSKLPDSIRGIAIKYFNEFKKL